MSAITPVHVKDIVLEKVYLSEAEYTNDFGRGGIRVMYEYSENTRAELLVRTDDLEFRFGLGRYEKPQKKGTFDYSVQGSFKKNSETQKALARLDARIVDLLVERWPEWHKGSKMTAEAMTMTESYNGLIKISRSKTSGEEYDPSLRLMFREELDRSTSTRDFTTKVHHGTRDVVPIDRENLTEAIAAETSGPVVFSIGLFLSKSKNVYCSANARMVNVKGLSGSGSTKASAAVVVCDDSFFADDEGAAVVTRPLSKKRNGSELVAEEAKRPSK
jgi:hypothetical protein